MKRAARACDIGKLPVGNREADALIERVASDLPEAMAEIGVDGESATLWPLSTIRC